MASIFATSVKQERTPIKLFSKSGWVITVRLMKFQVDKLCNQKPLLSCLVCVDEILRDEANTNSLQHCNIDDDNDDDDDILFMLSNIM